MRLRIWIGLAAVGAVVSCGGGDATGPAPSPVAGTLKVMLATPNADDGALLFTVSGGAISAVDPAAGYQVFTAHPDSNTTRVLLTGNIAAGEVIRIHVPDTRKLDGYHASIAQAASRTTFAAQTLSSYRLTLAP